MHGHIIKKILPQVKKGLRVESFKMYQSTLSQKLKVKADYWPVLGG